MMSRVAPFSPSKTAMPAIPLDDRASISRLETAITQVDATLAWREFPARIPTAHQVRKTIAKLRDEMSWGELKKAFLKTILPAVPDLSFNPENVRKIRLFNLALCVARRDWSALSREESTLILKSPVLGDLYSDWASTQAPAKVDPTAREGGLLVADVAYTWFRRARPGNPGSLVKSSTRVGIASIDDSDTEVDCRLWRGDGDGFLEVRRYGNLLLRPLLTPASWAPISLADCLEALSSGVAWRDAPHPFLDIPFDHYIDPDTDYCSLLSIGDVALNGDPATVADHRRIALRDELIRSACARLVVIGDGVWIPTAPPRACIMNSDAGPTATWRAGNLFGLTPQETICETKVLNRDFLAEIMDDVRIYSVSLPPRFSQLTGKMAEAMRFPSMQTSPERDADFPTIEPRSGSDWRDAPSLSDLGAASATMLYVVGAIQTLQEDCGWGRSLDPIRQALADFESACEADDTPRALAALTSASKSCKSTARPPKFVESDAQKIIEGRKLLWETLQQVKAAIAGMAPSHAPDDDDAIDSAFSP